MPTPLSHVTRQDRAISDDAWIVDFLRRTAVGTLATAQIMEDGQPQPFTNTQLFVYDPARHAILLHTGRRGRMFRSAQHGAAMEQRGAATEQREQRAVFTAFEMGRLLPAETALNFSVEYASVVAFGRLRVLADPAEARAALQLLLDKYFAHLRPGQHYRPITQGELDATAVYLLQIEEWSAKRKQVEEDFAGAFLWGAEPGG